MLRFAPGVKVYLACEPVDMRRGFDGLAADVVQTLRTDPYSGAAFVFRSKRGDYVKILTWDGSGLCLFAKRPRVASVHIPSLNHGRMNLSTAFQTDSELSFSSGVVRPPDFQAWRRPRLFPDER
jgi:transposase